MQDLGKVNNRYVRDLRALEVRRFFDIVLETHLPHLVKDELLEDVDGSLMQRYWLDGKMIRVYNSNDIRSVYIDSEVELEPYFRDKSREKTPLAECLLPRPIKKIRKSKKNFKKLFQNTEKCAIIVSEPSNRTAICGKTIKKEVFDMEIKKQLTTCPKEKPKDESKLGFGHIFTDHMLVMPYDEGQGWHDPVIMPYGDITLSPSAMCLHYGQTVFEGLKAYRRADGGVQLFRPDENFKRLNRSNERLVIPELPEELGLQCLMELISVEKDWVPHTEGASLYIRPFIFAVDPFLGVHPGEHYLFMIILSPSGPYYASGLDPVNIYVENKYVRTVRGGMGYAKTGGNYAASLHSQADAYEQGYSQVLWLDGVEQKYIEEVGAMNIAFVIDGEVVTPSLETGSILSGITRKSALELCRSKGIPVSERRITIQEIADAYDAGKLSEVFGTGTAAVISPVGHLKWGDKVMTINNNKIGPVSQMIYDTLTGIQWGKIPDKFGWIVPID